MQALLLLSSVPETCYIYITTINSLYGTNKLEFEGINDLILGEDIHRKNT